MLSKKYTVLLLFAGVVAAEAAVDTRLFVAAQETGNNKMTWLASGRVDNLFPRTSPAKYANVVQDNVFSPMANNTAVTTGVQKHKPKLALQLRGVTITPNKKFAVIWDAAANKSTVVDEGESVMQWKVVTIETDHVVITSGEKRHELFVRQEQDNRK